MGGDSMIELYHRIKRRREELNLSQDELAQRLGYKSRSSINKIEKGINDIPQSKIKAFAVALNTSPEYLMGWTDNKSQTTATHLSLSDHDRYMVEAYNKADDIIKDIVDNALNNFSKVDLKSLSDREKRKTCNAG